MTEAYAKQMLLPEIGLEGQNKLKNSSVLVVGIGGLGCAALPYLAASGIQRIGLIDFDRVEASNLARQILFTPNDVGRWKVEVAQERIKALNPEVQLECKNLCLTQENAQESFLDYDIVIDGTDNLESRLAINDACKFLKKPWVYGSIHQWEGQVALFVPNKPDYRSLFPEGTSELRCFSCSSGGVLGPFVGLVGSIQATTAIKWLVGINESLSGKLLLINGMTWRFTLTNITTSNPAYEISFSQLKLLQEHETVQLIDVRQPHEKSQGDLGGGPFIPDTIHKNQKVVIYCQSGIRSFILMQRLRNEGIDAYSLEGGMDRIR